MVDGYEERLAEISTLTPGWYFGEGEEIDDKTIELARQMLSYIPFKVSVYPTVDGGITLEWPGSIVNLTTYGEYDRHPLTLMG